MTTDGELHVSAYAIERVDAASEANLAALVAVHEEAAAWLLARGIDQWRPGEYTLATLRRELDEGREVYVARRAGDVAGGFTLQWDDLENWEEQPPVAGYLHALCVRRADAGSGLGAAMLDYAGQRVAEYGRPCLRLDCWKDNTVLRAYYEGQGFTYQGIGDHGWASLYQRVAGARGLERPAHGTAGARYGGRRGGGRMNSRLNGHLATTLGFTCRLRGR